uniref:Limonene hydroxylase n=1 Tax=candidate division KSB3 bacterium TaxID=2044937 RepID=A0A2G6KIY7_9BACT|nr:MAG: limonene hydroxylase [candidate division KSB3 bacterium]
MGTLSFLFDHHITPEDLPWHGLPAIYPHIKDNLDTEGSLNETGKILPDEEWRFHEGDLKWVPGGMDGAFGHHFGGNDQKRARNIVPLIKEIARSDSQAKKIELYNVLLADDLVGYIDPLLESMRQQELDPEPYLRNFARWLAQEGTDRGPVKFAIALLGLVGIPEDVELVALLGKHEEFTLYAAVAIHSLLDDPLLHIWNLAKHVSGWGRIHLVERLAKTDHPDIQDWLIREGYKNEIMYEYLAYICATSGDLKSALAEETIDEELLNSAGELIESLIIGGPAEDIDDYDDAPVAIQRYLAHLEPMAHTLQHFLFAHLINSYLSELKEHWTQRKKQGWNLEIRNTLLQTSQRILQRPLWKELVERDLTSDDSATFYTASQAAELLDIDTWDVHWKKLLDKPLEARHWYEIMRRANEERIVEIVKTAREHLELDKIAIGPGNDLGLGEEYARNHCLDFILQGLGQYPGTGQFLVEIALLSPVTRNRNMAIRVLSLWAQEQWTLEIETLLQEAFNREPNEDVQERIRRVLDGEPLDFDDKM